MLKELLLRRFDDRFKDTQPANRDLNQESSPPSIFEDSVPNSHRSSPLPAMTDEILVLAKEIQGSLCEMLLKQRLQAKDIEVRRRLSTQEFRVYITLSSPIGIEVLTDIECLLFADIQRTHKVEIASFFWRYRQAVH